MRVTVSMTAAAVRPPRNITSSFIFLCFYLGGPETRTPVYAFAACSYLLACLSSSWSQRSSSHMYSL